MFQPKEPKKLSLKDASEGYIGKLQILRSGKARYGKKQWTLLFLLQYLITHSCCFPVASLSNPHASSTLSSATVLHCRPNLPACGRNQNNRESLTRVSNCSPLKEATSFRWLLSLSAPLFFRSKVRGGETETLGTRLWKVLSWCYHLSSLIIVARHSAWLIGVMSGIDLSGQRPEVHV